LGRPGWKPSESNGENARHKSDILVEKYIGNAELTRRNLEDNLALCMKQKLGPHMECFLVSGQLTGLNQMRPNNNHVTNLPEAAKLFVECMLGVPDSDPRYRARYRDASFILKLCYEKKFNDTSPEQNLNAVGTNNCQSRIMGSVQWGKSLSHFTCFRLSRIFLL
jgi:hypothetical protein